jgi:hypothetical protein
MTISITLTNNPPSPHIFKTNLYLNSVALILLHDFSQVPSDISSKDEQSVNEVFPFYPFFKLKIYLYLLHTHLCIYICYKIIGNHTMDHLRATAFLFCATYIFLVVVVWWMTTSSLTYYPVPGLEECNSNI